MNALLLVDDHASSRQPLALLLRLTTDFDQVREAGNIQEALDQLSGLSFAIIDLGLPDGNGSTLIRVVREQEPSAHILVLTSSSDRSDAARAIASGASGVLHKTAAFDDIIAAIQDIADGKSIVTDQQREDVRRLQSDQRRRETLTPRELDVIACLADGLSDREIADRLDIGIETVRTHLGNAFGKLGVDSRLQALTYALQHNLLPDRPGSGR